MIENIVLNLAPIPLSAQAQLLIDDASVRAKDISWFDFVPSNYEVVYSVLAALQRGRFCDWGCGLGVITGMAEMLGYDAMGVEIHEPLAIAGRKLLLDHGLKSAIEVGDLFERQDFADLYFAYCWPGMVIRTEERFLEIAAVGSRLIVYYGPNDVRWMRKPEKR